MATSPSAETTARTVLITGAASGIGRAVGRMLKAHGFSVFGTSRRPEAHASSDFPLITLDVLSDDSVRAAVERVRAATGRLDVLINNAAQRFVGAVEETSIEEAKAVFDANFFGVHRVTRDALPLLRAAGRGSIVNVSSLAGLNAAPFAAVYSASKSALEAYSESLRQELKPLGIRVSLIEPGAVRSETRQAPQTAAQPIAAYAGPRQRALGVISALDQRGMDVNRVAECVLHVLQSPSPKLRYRVGPDATWLPRLRAALPWSWYEEGVRRKYHLDDSSESRL